MIALTAIGVALSSGVAVAQCSAYPHILTNGSIADANQVMDNFNCAAKTSGASLDTVSFLGVGTATRTGLVSVLQNISSVSPSLDIRVTNGTATSSSLRVNQPTNYGNFAAVYSPSRAILDVGTFADSSGVGYSGIFRGSVGIGTTAPTGQLGISESETNSTANLDIRLTNAAGSASASLLTVNQSTSWNNALATLGARSELDVGVYGDASGTGYSATFRGSVGIGTSTPSYPLYVNGTIYASGGAGALSDVRHKKDIRSLPDGILNDVMRLRPVTFRWKVPGDAGMRGTQVGFVAQEVESVFPDVVLTENNAEKTKGLKYNELIAILTKGVQEQEKEIADLHAEVSDLKRQLGLRTAER